MLFFQKLKYEFIEFLYFLHIRVYKSFDRILSLKFFSWMKTKWSFVYFANSGGSNSNLNCSFSSLILKRSVDIWLLLGWFSTEDLLLLLFGRFFLCFFLYLFFSGLITTWLKWASLLQKFDEGLLLFISTFSLLAFVLESFSWSFHYWHCWLYFTNMIKDFYQTGSSGLVTRWITN